MNLPRPVDSIVFTGKYLHMAASTSTAYRVNFAIGILSNLFHYSIALITITLVFNRFPSVAGWTRTETILLYSLSLLPFSIFGGFLQRLSDFSTIILQGTLDRYMLRPRNVFGQLLLEGFNPLFVFHFIFAAILFIYACSTINTTISVSNVIFVMIVSLAGAAIMAALTVIASAISIFTLNSGALFQLLIYSPREMSWYPASMYPSAVQAILFYIIPFCAINYIPAQVLLDKPGAPSLLGAVAILFGLVAAIAFIAAQVWFVARRFYSSAGN